MRTHTLLVLLAMLTIGSAGVQAQQEAKSAPSAGAPGGIIFFDKQQVDAMFTKGGQLFNGLPMGKNYQISTSRRTGPGPAEVHAEDTDITYVVDGSGTLVTGGFIVGGKQTAPGEIRGTSIEGGQSRQIGKGDVFIIPKGVPHWVQKTDGALMQFHVKVR